MSRPFVTVEPVVRFMEMDKIQKVAEGLPIFAQYREPSIAVGHDILYAGAESTVSAKDDARLTQLDWFWDAESDSWAIWL